MSVERTIYLDSSAIVKLAVDEPESAALRRSLRRKHTLVTSALARTEVARAILYLGPDAVAIGLEVLTKLEIIRINDRILRTAGTMLPAEFRSLDAIHLATALELGEGLVRLITYDDRMALAARALHLAVSAPA